MSEPEEHPRARYALGVLFVVYAFSLIDRQILAMLLVPIQAEMDLRDWQLGFLSGLAFALFYSTMGIPLARVADRGSRRNVIAIGMLVWSAATALCGSARSFWHLALARVAVGAGEAAGGPPSHSLISDLFPPQRRARALAIYTIGSNTGIMAGFMLGGWLSETIGWRWTFVVVGLPGVAIAALVRASLPEPERGAIEARTDDEDQPPFGEVMRYLFGLRTYRQILLASGLFSVASYGFMFWVPVFLERVHEMGRTEIGLWLGIITGSAGAIGNFAGGWTGDRGSLRDERWLTWVSGFAGFASLPFVAVFLLVPQTGLALVCYLPIVFFNSIWISPTYAAIMGLASLRMRATASAVLLFVVNLVGQGIGPQLIGLFSDVFEPTWGRESIRYSLLLVVAVAMVWGSTHFFLAARSVREELARARAAL